MHELGSSCTRYKNVLSHFFLPPAVDQWIYIRVKHAKLVTELATENSSKADFLGVSPLSELLEEFEVVCGWHGTDLPHWSVDGAKATMACS